MDGYEKETYGERIAADYDRLGTSGAASLATGGPDEVAGFLAELAGPGRALELAVGTGRIALPLAARGVDVSGIDISPSMVERLREKPGGTDIEVALGDFADVEVAGRFRLIYLVFNTLFALTDEGEQARCFANVAAHLEPGGAFVIEAFVPDLGRFVDDQSLRVRSIELDRVVLDASIHHPADQRVDSQHIVIGADGVRLFPVSIRYAWPEQLDVLAESAGLRRRDRFGDWRSSAFTDDSGFHVSVYEPA
jgi:SAM-dependent methyltransferase